MKRLAGWTSGLLAALAGGLLLLPSARPPAAQPPAAPRPNFILINIDDLGYADIGPFGSPRNRTPNLDRMAKEGRKLTSFYAAPVCSPSRAALMTGCYAKRALPIPHVLFPGNDVGLSPEEVTVAEVLKGAGYVTGIVGKWHLGDQPEFLPTRQGFDYFYGLPYSNDMGPAADGIKSDLGRPLPAVDRANQPPLPLMRNETVLKRVLPDDQQALVELYTDEAVRFIERSKNRPFFLYLPHSAVHFPLYPGKKWAGKSPHGLYSDWVEEVDWSVGQVLDAVRRQGLAERTLVIFTSDNGGTARGLNTPLRGHKGSTLEGGMRVPFVAWWPGKVPAGTETDAVAAMFDLLPTFAALAGGKVPPDRKIDGVNLWPHLSGAADARPAHVTFYYYRGLRLEAVRHGDWKLQLPPAMNPNGPPKLYNLRADIGEASDAAAAHPEIVEKLFALATATREDLGPDGPGPGCRALGKVAEARPLIDSAGKVRPGFEPGEPARRFQGNPIIRPEMLPGRDGANINGPSLIRVPDWIPNPLGRYYLYFAHHNGTYIRLAYADRLEGPWKIHAPGTLHLREVPAARGHVASPDVHLDPERKQVRMYFHGPSAKGGGQKSFVAVSSDGLRFKASEEVLGTFYFRVFPHGGYWYAMAKGGDLFRSRDGLSGFEPGGNPFPPVPNQDPAHNQPGSVRHVALHRRGDTLDVYFSRIGDAPESILRSRIELGADWKQWKATAPKLILRPELPYEGADLPVQPSRAGAVKGPENGLRDPAIYTEGDRIYLLYSVAAESGLAVAELKGS